MTYGPGPGPDIGRPNPHQPPPQSPLPAPPNNQTWAPPPPPAPPPRRNRRAGLIAVVVAGVLVVAVVVTVVLAAGNDPVTAWSGGVGFSSAAAPTSATGPQPSPGSAGGSRPLPPPTPTGKLYKDEDPVVGACADLSRRTGGVSIYQADCADPAATLILESVQPKGGKCGKGYFGLTTLSDQLLCFTYAFTTGDCINILIPRRTLCDDTPGAAPGPPKDRVVDVRLGQRDGAGCPTPTLFYQVGKGDQRGVGCLAPAAGPGTAAPPPPPPPR